MVTFRVELASAPNRDGQFPVRLRITADRRHKRISLGFAIAKKDLNPKATLDKANWIRAGHPQQLAYNNRIREKCEAIINAVSELSKESEPTVEAVEHALLNGNDQSFIAYYRKQLEYVGIKNSLETAENYGVPLNKIIKQLQEKGKSDLTFRELTPAWLKSFETYMIQIPNSKNTVSKQLGFVKTIVSAAIKDKLLSPLNNPFQDYKFSFEETEREKLSPEEVKQLEDMPLDPTYRVCHARDIFLFMYYTHGMRIGDALFLRVSNIHKEPEAWRCRYQMHKTDSRRNVKLTEKARLIVEKYAENKGPNDFLFPFVELGKNYNDERTYKDTKSAKTSIVNKGLGKIKERLGWEKNLTCHIARHTFADAARVKGANTYTISKALGHARLSTTEKYLKSFDQNAVDEINDIFE